VLFNSLRFAEFFAVVFALWSAVKTLPTVRFWLLTVASLAFYAVWNPRYALVGDVRWDPRYLLLLGFVAAANFTLGQDLELLARDARRRGRVMAFAVVFNLGVLGAFKYTDFALHLLRPLAGRLGVDLPGPLHWVLPVGISFFTFQGLGYVVDVHRGDKPAVKRFRDLFLALAFFPHLVAGPIVRPWELIPSLHAPKPLDDERLGRALLQFLRGLVKKAAADALAVGLVNRVFDLPSHYSAPEVLAAAYGYAFQIYGDFSGYTDMAIGVAGLLGIDLPQNFDHPYASTSLREFWRRWHMSLSRWLRDYLYISLGGSRGSFWATQRNLFLTMLLGGLWHGASINFIIWGAIHGGLLVAERLWERAVGLLKAPALPALLRDVVGGVVTFHVVVFAWVFFRAESFDTALALLERLWSGWRGGVANVSASFVGLLAAGFVTHLFPGEWRRRLEAGVVRAPAFAQALLVLACLYVARLLSGTGATPFIYFQF
jgi:D-alanyl-lipoteichoic acid acyltransferase DltB (MBOAT superfamily)